MRGKLGKNEICNKLPKRELKKGGKKERKNE